MITEQVAWWARYSVAITAEWARKKGYMLVVVDESHPSLSAAGSNMDVRFGKVLAIRSLLLREDLDVDFVFWLDADAVVVDHQDFDIVKLMEKYPGKDIVVGREANLETNNVINSGSMVFRSSAWSIGFLGSWFSHPSVGQGAPDQYTFDRLWEEDKGGVREKTQVLPATEINSEPPWYDTWQTPAQQPVIHLMGDHGKAREQLFKRMYAGLCSTLAGRAAADWPVTKDWMVESLQTAFQQIAEDKEGMSVHDRTQALQRLGQIYGYRNQRWERIRVLEEALKLKEAEYKEGHSMVAHELGVLGNLHSQLGQFEVSLSYLNRALAINQKATNPLGEPYLHLVAASMVDLATCYSRAGRHEEALARLQEAVAIEEKIYGENHKNVADTLHNMGVVLKMMGREREANKQLKRALESYKMHLAPEHPLISMVRTKMNKPMDQWS